MKILLFSLALFSTAPQKNGYTNIHGTKVNESKAKGELIKTLSKSHDPEKIKEIFGDKRLKVGIVTDEGVARGMEYWHEHEIDLIMASGIYKVPAEAIIAIMWVESSFGKNVGRRPAFNTFYEAYLVNPERKESTQKEMDALLRISELTGKDTFDIPGSSAGAIGIPQFMPSSYFTLAVDGNDDGVIDLFNHSDAIFSIANYLSKSGWGESTDSREAAVHAYNHSNVYVNDVLDCMRALAEAKGKKDREEREEQERLQQEQQEQSKQEQTQ